MTTKHAHSNPNETRYRQDNQEFINDEFSSPCHHHRHHHRAPHHRVFVPFRSLPSRPPSRIETGCRGICGEIAAMAAPSALRKRLREQENCIVEEQHRDTPLRCKMQRQKPGQTHSQAACTIRRSAAGIAATGREHTPAAAACRTWKGLWISRDQAFSGSSIRFSMTLSTSPNSFAASAVKNWSRSNASSIFFMLWPVCLT
jgi:hypothetical protein